MSGHTPGPWSVSRYRLNFGRVVTLASHLDRPFGGCVDFDRHRATYMAAIAHVCDESSRHFDPEEGDANAHLIAAAPDMLDMLKRCADLLDDYSDVNDGEDGPRPNRAMSLLTDVVDIIAKAEGR